MAKKVSNQVTTKSEKQFLDTFNSMCYTRNAWEVWTDFVTAAACSIANSVDREGKNHDDREAEYAKCIERLGGVENAAKLFAIIVEAFEENPEQDFLGGLFMKLNLGNHWKGQFFTPYCVCKTMAAINSVFLEDTIKEKGWVSVNDPACGAGATLVAMANTLKEHNVNYQNHALFVAQDIDRVAGLMCYIQLSLLGCPGYVVIADTLCNPLTGRNALFPQPNNDQEIWYTPMFASEVWEYRRKFNLMDMFLQGLN